MAPTGGCYCCFASGKKTVKSQRREQTVAAQVSVSSDNVVDDVADRELFDLMREELMNMPEKDRLPLSLYFFGGLDYEKLGIALKCKPATARVKVHRCLCRLRKRLGKAGIASTILALTRTLEASNERSLKHSINRNPIKKFDIRTPLL